MKRAADGAADRPEDDCQDQSDEHAEHGVQVEDLLHLVRVCVVEPKDDEERAEEEYLRHQRLDHATLVAEDQRDDQDQHDDEADDQAVLCLAEASTRRGSMTSNHTNSATLPTSSLRGCAMYTPDDCAWVCPPPTTTAAPARIATPSPRFR